VRKDSDEVNFYGLECDWLAVDRVGHVGFFSSAGRGYLPVSYREDPDEYVSAIEAILSLPVTSHVGFAPVRKNDEDNHWLLMALRGIFAFDAGQSEFEYEILALPRQLADVSSLPKSVRNTVVKAVVDVDFAGGGRLLDVRNNIVR
jgi:hypothetical protein